MFSPSGRQTESREQPEHERVRTQRLPVGRRSRSWTSTWSARHRHPRRVEGVRRRGGPPTRREPLFPTRSRAAGRHQERFAASWPTAPLGIGAIRRDHGRGNAAGRVEEEIDSRTARATRPPAPRIRFRDQHPRYGAKGVRPPTPTGHRAGAREHRLPRPAAGRRPRYGSAPAAIDHHDTNRLASRFRPERRARCCRWLPGGPLAATGSAPVSRARHSAAAHRPRPPPHEHAGSGPAAEGGRPQVRTTDPSTWIGPGTTMLDRFSPPTPCGKPVQP